MKIYWFALLAVIVSVPCMAQQRCAQHIQEQHLRDHDAALNEAFEEYDANMINVSMNSGARAEVLVVPVVFHVLHQNGAENISDEQIRDCMRIVNEDFNARNPELSEIVPGFEDIIGNAEIEFRLARIDPNGNPTTGIDRIQSFETSVGDDGSKLNQWPRNMYLNIWTADVIGISNAAAYAYRPPAVNNSGNAGIDGIMANHRYVGSIGTAASTNSPHTMSHEIGHYLGLPHPWGGTNEPELSSNCNIDDGVFDTPNTVGTSGGCPLTQQSCGSLDNVQNFMDYAACDAMFTEGQINVMRNTLNSGTAQRNQLGQDGNLAATGVSSLTFADFTAVSQGVCFGDNSVLFDASQYDATEWSWLVEGDDEALTSTNEDPTFDLEPGVYDVSLEVTQDGVTQSVMKEAFLVVERQFGEGLPFSEDFEDYDRHTSVWAVNNILNNDYTWKPYTGDGTLGTTSFRMQNFGNDPGATDELILGSVDTRGITTMNMSFKVAYAQVNAQSEDELTVFVSNSCGVTWQQVWSRSGSQLAGSTPMSSGAFSASPSDWEEFDIANIPEFWIGESTFIKFVFTNGGGNHLYLDDINIDGTYIDVPQLVFPADGTTDAPDNVTLDWRSVKDVNSYEFEVDVTNEFNSDERQSFSKNYVGPESDGDDTRFSPEGLQIGQQYFWRVRTVTSGTASDWSEVWSFTVSQEGVGIEQTPLADQLLLFPNPTQNLLNVQFDGVIDEGMSLEVMDLTGRPVSVPRVSGSGNLVSFSTSELPNGWYVLRITLEGETVFKQFAVSH